MSVENTGAIRVSVSEDEMSAYLTLPEPVMGARYTVDFLLEILEENNIVSGVKEYVLERMIGEKIYDVPVQVAFGRVAVDGTDGYYTFQFEMNPNRKPLIREDGTVDYWSVNLIQTVVEGQVIAVYNPAVQGESGHTVTGKELTPKIGKELAPLRGRGFERSADNRTYTAVIDGKIEFLNGRINITNFYEVYDDIDIVFGNVDFAGDVVIHGNICAGMSVRAGGSLTVEGVVEGASIWAGKDIILKGGVLGDGKAQIFSRGNIYASFFEYARVEALGMIQADSLLQCDVECRKNVVLEGKKGVILGGRVHAIEGIEANEIGNPSELKCIIEVGIGDERYQKMNDLQEKIAGLAKEVKRIEQELKKFDQREKDEGVSYRNNPQRVQLLRDYIRDSSTEKADRFELSELRAEEEAARTATVHITRAVYPGVQIVIGRLQVPVKSKQVAVEYVVQGGHIVMRGDEIVG